MYSSPSRTRPPAFTTDVCNNYWKSSTHLLLGLPWFLLPSNFPSNVVFYNLLYRLMRPKYESFCFLCMLSKDGCSMLVTSTLVQTSSLVVFWVQGIILEDKFCLYCPLDMYWIPGFFRGQFVFAVFAVVIQSAKTTRHKLGQYTSRKRRKNS